MDEPCSCFGCPQVKKRIAELTADRDHERQKANSLNDELNDHPLCGAHREQIRQALMAHGFATLREQEAADEDRAPEETAVQAFWRTLGQESQETTRERDEAVAHAGRCEKERDEALLHLRNSQGVADHAALGVLHRQQAANYLTLEAEVSRMRAREQENQELQRAIHRPQQENDRLSAPSPRDDEDARAIARQSIFAYMGWDAQHEVHENAFGRAMQAALAEARKRRPHGTWVPVEPGDTATYTPLPQEGEVLNVGALVMTRGGEAFWGADHIAVKPLPPESQEKCEQRHEYLARTKWKFCPGCGEKLEVPVAAAQEKGAGVSDAETRSGQQIAREGQ